MAAVEKSEPGVGELLGSLATTTASLVKQEVQLVSTELSAKTTQAAQAAGMIGLGGAILHAGALVVMFAVVVGLAAIVPMWISAGVLGVTAICAGSLLFAKGLNAIRRLDPVPRQTLQTLRDDAVWAKEQVR